MAWYYWAGGAAAASLLGYTILKGASGNAQPSADSGGAQVAGTPMAAPLFMASGGGTSQMPTNDSVLGGTTWEPPKVPLSENPDIAIAKINADVNMAAIDAGKAVQMAGIATAANVQQIAAPVTPPIVTPLPPPVITPPPYIPPPIVTPPPPPPNTPLTKTEYRGHDSNVGALYINTYLKNNPGASSEQVEQQIYDAAKAQGFSATEVAASIYAASGKLITPAQVNEWITMRGLSPL